MSNLSPMMQQYVNIKNQNKNSILFFRLGDFYEMFFDDAKIVSKELELTLTGKDCGTGERAPMCGIPYHSCDTYIAKLIEKGYKIAICEQSDESTQNKGLMKRDVVRVITPGTVYENNLLDESKNNFICSIFLSDVYLSFCACDISTGEINFTIIENDEDVRERLKNELNRFMPSEILYRGKLDLLKKLQKFIATKIHSTVEILNAELTSFNYFENKVLSLLNGKSLEDKYKNSEIIICLGQLLDYLEKNQKDIIKRLNTVSMYSEKEYMKLNYLSIRNLEILESLRESKKFGSLLWVIDNTKTAMGKRLIKNVIKRPLLSVEKINRRLDSVEELTKDIKVLDSLEEELKGIFDLERILTKIVFKNCNARDLRLICSTLGKLPNIKLILKKFTSDLLINIENNIDSLTNLKELIDSSIVESDIPLTVKDGGIIKTGFNDELDELKNILFNAKDYITKIELKEKEKTGIYKLKIGFNKVFGYYLEVPNSQKGNVPDYFIRKQTLSNCERYITSELKDLEYKILNAKNKINDLEYNIFLDLRNNVAMHLKEIQKTATNIAKLDVLCSFAVVSLKNEYNRPIISTDGEIILKDARHPVVEVLGNDVLFIPNDTNLDLKENRLALITGPNMAGKSTYMRQVALITLMAQIGCFVPAAQAKISIVDGIYTRVGASDDLVSGQSTFMVEMNEVADTLKNATKNSLIIFDEIGRGTSTFDGMSIAKAVIEYIANENKLGAKTLFSTHYHELTELENEIPGVKNYSVAVKKKEDSIVFLRKIVKGGAKESYGIEVARLANIPDEITKRAKEILKSLEYSQVFSRENSKTLDNDISLSENSKIKEKNNLLNINEQTVAKEILNTLSSINVEMLTPIESLNILSKLVKYLDKVH